MDYASRMARAEAMGFRLNPVYHGTATGPDGHIFSAFDPARVGGRTSGSQAGQEGVSVALNPEVANEFALLSARKSGGNPAVMPLLHRTERPAAMNLDGTEKNLEVAATLSEAFNEGGRDAVALKNYTTPGGKTGEIVVVLKDPSQLRSVNAAFDPEKRGSSDLMASRVEPALAVGGAAAALLPDDAGAAERRLSAPALKEGPAPTGRDKLFDALYGALGGTPDKRWAADKLTTALDYGTLGMLTGAYDGGRELAETGRPASLAMALMPGAKGVRAAGEAAETAAKTGIRAFHGGTTTSWRTGDWLYGIAPLLAGASLFGDGGER